MFSSALKVLALAAVALALPAAESTNATAVSEVEGLEVPDATALDSYLTLCVGAFPYVQCTNLPTDDGVCFNIRVDLAYSGGGKIPSKTMCTFYRNANCPGFPRAEMVTLSAGIYDLTQQYPNAEGDLVTFSPRQSYFCRPGGPAL